jgi:hypothetical protein
VAISYTPTTGYTGTDSFTYTATNITGTSAPAPVIILVGKIPVTVTLANLAPTYNGNALSATATTAITSSSAPVTVASITYTYTSGVTTLSGPPTAAGTYGVTATVVDPAYQGAATGSLVIAKAAISVTVNAATSIYGVAFAPFTGTLNGVINGDGITATYTTTATPTSAAGGIYSITATLVDSNSKLGNYAVTNTPAVLTITKSAQTLIFPTVPANVTYGVAPITLASTSNSALAVTYTVTGPATLSGSTLTITGSGSVIITAAQVGNGNYNAATPLQQTITVAQAPLTVTANTASMAYGGPLPTLSGTLTGIVGADGITASYTTNATVASPIGTYTVTPSLNDLNSRLANYSITKTPAVFTITNSTLTVTAISVTRVYGAANPPFTATYTGQQGADTFTATATSTALSTTPAGTVAIVPAVTGTNILDYTVILNNGTLTISKASVAVALTQTTPTTTGVGTGISTTFTVAVTDAGIGSSGTPTGTVQFLDGGTVLGASTLTSGIATFTTTFTTAATHSITAVYQGDANFNAATSAAFNEVVVIPSFTVAVNPNSLSIVQGSSGAATLTFTPVGNYQGTLSLACSGLPIFSSCTFVPGTITFTGNNAVQTSQLQVYTLNAHDAPTAAKQNLLWFPALLLAGFVAVRRRKLSRSLRPLLMLAIMACSFSALTGCGWGHASFVTPVGTDNITITATAIATAGSSSSNSTQSTTLTVIVTP